MLVCSDSGEVIKTLSSRYYSDRDRKASCSNVTKVTRGVRIKLRREGARLEWVLASLLC